MSFLIHIKLQVLESATKMRKFCLSLCGVPNHEMKQLVDLMEQTPILPNATSILWIDDEECADEGEWDWDIFEELLDTFKRKFPHSAMVG
jgi:hypothetical protein